MTILVVGGGAVGSFLAWALRRSGHGVTIVRRGHTGGRDAEFVTVVGPKGDQDAVDVVSVGRPAELPQPPDVVVFAVKMYDLDAAIDSCPRWSDAAIVTVQNGIGAEETVAGVRPDATVVAASLTAAIEPSPDGVWRWLRTGGLGLAPASGAAGPVIDQLSAAFVKAGLPVRVFEHAPAMKWSKLVGNLVGNATAAILDMDVGAIYRHRQLYRIERTQIREALAVMDRLGAHPLPLPGADVRLLVRVMSLPERVARPLLSRVLSRARGGKDPSLLIHVRSRGGRSEVEWMNGAVVRFGETTGTPTPVNRRLTQLVAEVSEDADRRAWFRHRPDRLLAAIGDSAA